MENPFRIRIEIRLSKNGRYSFNNSIIRIFQKHFRSLKIESVWTKLVNSLSSARPVASKNENCCELIK